MVDKRTGEGGRSVVISHTHKDFFCLDWWSLKREQKFKSWVENTAISRKVVKKICMRQSWKVIRDQYTVPNDCSCQTYLCCFPLALANISPWPPVPFFQMYLKNSALKITHNTFCDCRVHVSDNLSRNSCVRSWVWNITRWPAKCAEWVSSAKFASQSNVEYWFRHQK